MERNPLGNIFGEGALRVIINQEGRHLVGTYDLAQAVSPLEGIEHHPDRVVLAVTEEQMSGHFAGPLTLPAYRTLEFASHLRRGERIVGISSAKFTRIVEPGDVLSASNDEGRTIVCRDGSVVASAEILFEEDGLEAHQFGALLEIASQSIVANLIKGCTSLKTEYPLILGFKRLSLYNPLLGNFLKVIPNKYGAQITNDFMDLVAALTDINFEFATDEEIKFYAAYGRNYI